MPVSIPFTFTQSATTVTLELELPLSSSAASSPDVVITPLFLKLSAPPALLTVDLSHAIVPHTASLKRHHLQLNTRQRPRFTLQCTKETAGEWAELEWKGTKDEREVRRRESMRWWEEDEERKRKERSEQRRRERKEDKESGWEWQRQQKEQILAAKNRERVVALDELKSWQQQRQDSQRELWKAKTGETIEVLDNDEVEQRGYREEKAAEEHKYATTCDDKQPATLEQYSPPPTASIRPTAPPPPIRSTSLVTASFTAVHPSQPSLPARESNPATVKAAVTAPASDVLSNLLQLKDRADAYYKRRDIQSAITAYTQLLDEKAIRQRQTESGSDSGWRYSWVMCRVLSNRSACYMALATRLGLAALAQQLANVQRAEEDTVEAIALLSELTSDEANEEEKRALLVKLRKRAVSLYAMQGKWEQALLQAQAAELKEEETATSEKAEAVIRGEDVTAQQEAEQLLRYSPAPLTAALRCLDTALSMSPLSLTALQLRLDVCARLGEWDKAVRDAVLGLSLCEQSQQSQQRLWWIGRRGECHLRLKQFTSAQADFSLLSSAATPYIPLTATSLPALLSALSYQQRHHTLLSSLSTLRSSSSYAQLRSALSSLLSLQSSTAGGAGGIEWMLGQVELVSEQGWCELKLSEYDACIASCSRAQAMWSQWSSQPQPSTAEPNETTACENNEAVREERLRLQAAESDRQAKVAQRIKRFQLLTRVRSATALCYSGRLSEGREEYQRVLEAMGASSTQSDGHEDERREVEADIAKLDAAIAAQR